MPEPLPSDPSGVHAEPGFRLGDFCTLCVIACNEEANLPTCLRSAADLFGQVVVLDTGSTDRTPEVARACGAEVYDFPWCDDFAAARNAALAYTMGRRIFWLDADDYLDAVNREALRRLLVSLDDRAVAYGMTCLSLGGPAAGDAMELRQVRLFPNLPGLRWRFRVYEQILPALQERGVEVRWSDVVIRHTGYADAAARRRKLERDERLITLELADRPDHPFALFNLGVVRYERQQYGAALDLFRRSAERVHGRDLIVAKLYYYAAQCQRRLGRPRQALAACQRGRRDFADDAQLLCLEGVLRRQLGDPAGAERCWLRLLTQATAPQFESADVGIRGYKTRWNLGVLYLEQGRVREAEAQWRVALEEQPGYVPALAGLADVALWRGRRAAVDEIIARLEQLPNGPELAAALRARLPVA